MYKKVLLFVLLYLGIFLLPIKAQQASLKTDSLLGENVYSLDSALLVPVKVPDTITPKTLRPLDLLTIAHIADSLSKGFGYQKLNFEKLNENFLSWSISHNTFQKGIELPKGEMWVLAFIAFLLVLLAVLKNTFSKQLLVIIQSFFSNRQLGNLNKEDDLFTSWPFLLLFIQFGFTTGMFFYLVAQNQNLSLIANGFQSFVAISVLIMLLFVLKILLLKLLGFVFNVQKAVNEYVSILYLSYFNSSLLFIPLVIALVLLPLKYNELNIAIVIVLVGIIFTFQFIRTVINILSHYRFSKVYLILYFCTLEICPILILIKVIGF